MPLDTPHAGFSLEDLAALAADPELAHLIDLLADPQRALIEIDREIVAREGLAGFIRLAWHTVEQEGTYKSNWHVNAICSKLEAVSRGEIKRLIVTIPPRHMKSLSVAVMWPAWDWIAHPERRFLFSSYAQNLSIRDSRKCRMVINSPWYQARWSDKVRLTGDQNTKSRFENTAGGYRLATSVGGQLTGEGGDVVAVDDPTNALEANSETERENVIRWWSESMSTRLNNPAVGAFVLIQQRLHERDLIGYVLEKDGVVEKGGIWHNLCLPAEFEPDHPYRWPGDPRTEKGELLWPEHMPRHVLNALATALGSYAAAGQLQQRPAPREGGLFKRHWFTPVRTLAADTKWHRSWDLAMTEKDVVKADPDYTAGVLIGFSEQRRKWVIAHVKRFRCNPGEVQARMKAQAIEDTTLYGYHRIVYPQDPGQAGKDQKVSIGLMLAGWSLESRPVSGDKVVRASPMASQAEMGNIEIYRPEHTEVKNDWQEPFLDEMCSFPTGAHDDQVDAAASGFNALSGGTQGLLEYFKKKLETRREDDAAKAAAQTQHQVAPENPTIVHQEDTANLARAYLRRGTGRD